MRILHVLRSPVGGLFRHVRDLARGQSQLGHVVGLVCDSATGGSGATALLESSKAHCAGGIATLPIARLPSPADLKIIADCTALARDRKFDIIHGHGAKGGLIARLVGRRLRLPSVYTPHGGSLHYSWTSPAGMAFLTAEKILARLGSGFVFVCEFEKRAFEAKIGLAGKPATVVHNGLWAEEFQPVVPMASATDLLFVGEVRYLKGIDLLLQAMVELRKVRSLSLTVVGDGPELKQYKDLAKSLGLADAVKFAGRLPIREALARGRMMVVPSRNESFPYVVLETVAAGVPILATRVGGIPEILPDAMTCHPTAGDIANHISAALANQTATAQASKNLVDRLKISFSADLMARRITGFYATISH